MGWAVPDAKAWADAMKLIIDKKYRLGSFAVDTEQKYQPHQTWEDFQRTFKERM